MATGGQRPKPAELRKAGGNAGKRPIPTPPAFAPGDMLVPPKRWSANGVERKTWAAHVPELIRTGVAKAIHQTMFEWLCEMEADRRKLRDLGDLSGAAKLGNAARIGWEAFGVTPSSAMRIGTIGTTEKADPADTFFGPRLAS